MTREELKPYENTVVQFDGWVEKWTHHPDGVVDVLLKSVKTRPYQLDQTCIQRDACTPTVSHHLWLRYPQHAGYRAMKRLDRVFGYAKIKWYTRANGTSDLGLTAIRSAPGGEVAAEIKDNLKSGDWDAAYRHFTAICDRINCMDLVVFDELSSPLQIMQDIKTRFIPLFEKNKATAATATKNGKCKGPKSFSDLLRTA